ncbi:hypothetical protein EK599_08410 [Vibrio sp. T187]|uniref:hypothetical protein n=1 Tax=Vibrio TaxID=662 RepID=UPI0010C9AF65|nr:MULTISPECIES: hypothetical protein [Vibrio]MBW3695716.1 hypothetical protein [Vibrio sp. T187]
MSAIEIPLERRYWLIRAGTNSGEYYQQFRLNGVVAIGHANNVKFDFEDGHILSEADKEHMIGAASARLLESSSQKKRGEVARLKGQLRRFLYEVNEGDTVISLQESNKVIVGVVTSKPYYADSVLHGRTGDKKVCDYNLRMNVSWGKPRNRELLPMNLDRTLRIPHTITEFKEAHQVRTLNHWLYPIHFAEGEVRCSLRIASEEDLSNHQLTFLSQTLDRLDALSSFVEYASQNEIDFNLEKFNEYLRSEDVQYGLKAQHLFMSPGYQFIQLSGSELKRLMFASLLAIAFDSADVSAMDLPEGVSEEQILALANQITRENGIASVKSDLKVSLPKKESSGRESEEEMGISLEDNSADSDPVDGSIL